MAHEEGRRDAALTRRQVLETAAWIDAGAALATGVGGTAAMAEESPNRKPPAYRGALDGAARAVLRELQREWPRRGRARLRIAALLLALASGAASAQVPPPDLAEGEAVRAFVTHFGASDISVIDPYAARVVARIETGQQPHGVAIAPDGGAVYVSNETDGTVVVLDPQRNAVVATLTVGERPNQIEVSADGRYLFVTLNASDGVAVVDTSERRVVRTVTVGRAPHIALRSPDGKEVYVTAEGDMSVVALDPHTYDVRARIPVLAFPRVLAVSPDGRRLYQTIRWLNGALVIDLARGKVVDRIALGEPVFAPEGKDAHGVAVSRDGRFVWLTTQTTNVATVVAAEGHAVLSEISVGKDPNWVALTPDDRIALVSNTASSDVTLIDARARRVFATLPVGSSPKRLAVGVVRVSAPAGGGTP